MYAPPGALVDEHGLPVGEDDDGEQAGDRDRDRKREVRAAGARPDEHDERSLGRVRDRRKRVGGEDRKREPLRQQRVLHLAGRHGAADEDALHAARGALRVLLVPLDLGQCA